MNLFHRITGTAAVLLAIAFNIPFSVLAATFQYPGILRRPAAEVMAAFAAGGNALILTWYAFLLCALALVGFAPMLALTEGGMARRPGLTVTAIVLGSLAGITQAIGLARWVFAVPGMVAMYVDPTTGDAGKAALEVNFAMLNQWGGVAVGEHIGQVLTAGWIGVSVAARFGLAGRVNRIAGFTGMIAVAGIALGLGEGLVLALGGSGDLFAMATVAGYLAMSLWLVLTGLALILTAGRADRTRQAVALAA